ncbi:MULTISPECIES: STAS domain-containing protein [Eubacteriales]|uniref:Anti-sigma factor antagonist n=1 Tax=Bittarella massiliensis (ex Durand et al. 2017) TaxID=1720313 RepID=A0AAQ1RX93_9FIRM|nr:MULTISPECIES: anti-sigma factor antagonist [Eubacteriales]ERI99929.1 putative anti-sigma F factor antagonist [Clostridium sp. ATCC 29733]MZL69225.1 anti-sigma factor antagonist [Bittarella massiliensis (ex Durand et al. 2017)]MZL79233.1 anti-sigma factor antagonist [Bittarella massiliensis (ex Durand et al. 2017)]SHG68348.1 stage II sporulation protein AA (anti-sigma F factor antagonist) [Bittarella massiliensis (ex Durand et al. 2017)]
MNVNLQGDREALTAFLEGEIDHHSARYFRDSIDERVASLGPKLLVLDFSGITFMDSSGIGLVMGRYRTMQQQGGELRVQGAKGAIRRILLLSGLDKLVRIE